MIKRKYAIKIISFLCCVVIVAGIVAVKAREFSDNKIESTNGSEENDGKLEEKENKKGTDSNNAIKNVSKKEVQIKENTLDLNEENEDCGIFFTLQSVTYKKGKYILKCKVKNSRKEEIVDVEKFANNFSVKFGETELKASLVTGSKKLKYRKIMEMKMEVKCETDNSRKMGKYHLYYTTEPEEDDDHIQQFRTEYVVKE